MHFGAWALFFSPQKKGYCHVDSTLYICSGE